MEQLEQNQKKIGAKQNIIKQLHITFHNPNTMEDTAKYLAKIIVNSLAEQEKTEDIYDDNGGN